MLFLDVYNLLFKIKVLLYIKMDFERRPIIGPKSRRIKRIKGFAKSNRVNSTSLFKTLMAKRRTQTTKSQSKPKPKTAKSKFQTAVFSKRYSQQLQPPPLLIGMEEVEELEVTLYTTRLLIAPNPLIYYFKKPESGVGTSSEFISEMYVDSDTSRTTVKLSEDNTYIVTRIFDQIIGHFANLCRDSVVSVSNQLKHRVTVNTCGFTTQIYVLLFLSIIQSMNTHATWFQRPYLTDEQLTVVIDECETFVLTHERLHLAIQAEICSYSLTTSGRQTKENPVSLCSRVDQHHFNQQTINAGVPYIYTFFNSNRTGRLSTYHHFCVFRVDTNSDMCIISDSWAGDTASRANWTRMMQVDTFLHLMRTIHETTFLVYQRRLINMLFLVPYHDVSEYASQQQLYKILVYEITPAKMAELATKSLSSINMRGGRRG